MHILITGAAGYIGTALVKKLIEKKFLILAIDNLIRGDYRYLLNYNKTSLLKTIIGDIRDQEKLGYLFRRYNINAIVHLAAIPGMERCRKDPYNAITTNIYGTYNVLENARKYDVNKIILASSAAVYGTPIKTPIEESHSLNPTNLYGVTKLAAEKLMKAYYQDYGLSTVILRLSNVYGVGLYTYWENVIPKFVRYALTGQPLTIYGHGYQSRDFIHVWDVVQAIELVLETDKGIAGEVFNVGTGNPISVNFIADIVSEIVSKKLNTKVKRVHLPPRKGEPQIRDFCLLINKIKEKLGFNPKWTIEKGVNQLIDYYLRIKGGKNELI